MKYKVYRNFFYKFRLRVLNNSNNNITFTNAISSLPLFSLLFSYPRSLFHSSPKKEMDNLNWKVFRGTQQPKLILPHKHAIDNLIPNGIQSFKVISCLSSHLFNLFIDSSTCNFPMENSSYHIPFFLLNPY